MASAAAAYFAAAAGGDHRDRNVPFAPSAAEEGCPTPRPAAASGVGYIALSFAPARRITAALQPPAPPPPMSEEFYRIKRLPPYVFAEVNRLKAQLPRRGHGHHRLRHGQPGHGHARPYRRQAGRDRAPAAHPPLFGLQGHPRPAPRPGRLLRPPLRGEARPRDRGDRHPRLQGGPRQPRHGDHRARRRDAGAEPELPDPPLRLHDRRRHAAPRPGAARRPLRSRSSTCARWSAPSSTRCRSRWRWSSPSRRTRRRRSATSTSTAI